MKSDSVDWKASTAFDKLSVMASPWPNKESPKEELYQWLESRGFKYNSAKQEWLRGHGGKRSNQGGPPTKAGETKLVSVRMVTASQREAVAALTPLERAEACEEYYQQE